MPTLEEVEGEVRGEPEFDSHLVLTCHALRKKELDQFTTEDLRIMVGQTISMPILLPRAIVVLERDPLAEGHLFPGDLLSALLRRGTGPASRPRRRRSKPSASAHWRCSNSAEPNPYRTAVSSVTISPPSCAPRSGHISMREAPRAMSAVIIEPERDEPCQA